ncbi:MAG: MFS transporter [Dehalococcoidia bacterium]|jgi:cyanate permease|nr:MFS transporter [Dehalococcoidia bacterium]MDP6781976.1 MFS transporter [Dehalococcoidia bacterium]
MSYNRQATYPWIVSLSCLIITIINGGIFFTFGVFINPLEDHFGWSRGEVSTAWTAMLVAYVPGSIILGRLADRHGPRLATAVAAVTVGLGLVLAGQVQNLASFVAAYAFIGFGTGATFTVPSATIQRWFQKRRGLMIGIVVSGAGTGGIFAPIAERWIASYGWQDAYRLLGIFFGSALAVAMVGALSAPDRLGLRPYGWGTEAASAGSSQSTGYTMGEASRLPAFWGLLAIIVLTMSPYLFVTAHLAPLSTGRGISASQAAWAVMLMAVFAGVGKVLLGAAAERIGWLRGAAIAVFINAAAVLWLMAAENPFTIYGFAMVFGVFIGGAIVLLMGSAAVFFGTRSLAELLGYFIGAEVLLGAVFSLVAGVVFDWTGSYFLPLTVTFAAFATAGVLALLIRPPVWKSTGDKGAFQTTA